jgi:hypothetical protein
MVKTYRAGDMIPQGDLIRAFVEHLSVPVAERDGEWLRCEASMRAILNGTGTSVLDGEIRVPDWSLWDGIYRWSEDVERPGGWGGMDGSN